MAANSSPLPDYGLPLLPSLPCPDFKGPTPWSNWVIKGRVIAGAYPASLDDAETEHILTTLLELGMNTFVCLQAEVSLHTPESAWRSGQGLRPYIKDAQKLLIRARSEGSSRIKQDKLDFLHLPILDGNVTSDTALSRLADDCCQRILRGERLYIHCWGGHGRTGTLVAVMLGRLYHLSCAGALRYTQAFHDSRRYPQGVRSPQTAVQVAQVKRLLPDPAHTRGIVYQRDPSIALSDEILRPASNPPSPASAKALVPRLASTGSSRCSIAAAAGYGAPAAGSKQGGSLIAALHPTASEGLQGLLSERPGQPLVPEQRCASPINQQRKEAIRARAGAGLASAQQAQQQQQQHGSSVTAAGHRTPGPGAAAGAGYSCDNQLGHVQQLLQQQAIHNSLEAPLHQAHAPAQDSAPWHLGAAGKPSNVSGSGQVINLTASSGSAAAAAASVGPAVMGSGSSTKHAVAGAHQRPSSSLGGLMGMLYPRPKA